MKPVVRKFHEKHPAIRIVPFDLTREEWRADAWTPTMTPSFILLFPNGKWVYREGVEGEKSFMAWIETHLDAAREEA